MSVRYLTDMPDMIVRYLMGMCFSFGKLNMISFKYLEPQEPFELPGNEQTTNHLRKNTARCAVENIGTGKSSLLLWIRRGGIISARPLA